MFRPRFYGLQNIEKSGGPFNNNAYNPVCKLQRQNAHIYIIDTDIFPGGMVRDNPFRYLFLWNTDVRADGENSQAYHFQR